MAAVTTRSSNPAIREVSRGLADAGDAQILRVVAMVDAMPDRGAADQLIAPLRERLARLRPPRPLRFARLLFLPLDPLVVPAARWRLEQPALPRTVIPLLAAAVQTALGPMGRAVATLIEGRTTHDLDIVGQAGEMLWEKAARVLLDAECPPGWDATGLSASAHRPLSRRIGALLFQAGRLRRIVADVAQGEAVDTKAVLALLEDAAAHDPLAQPMAVGLLLARVPEAAPALARILALLGQSGKGMSRQASEQVTDMLLDQLEAPGGGEGQLGGQDLAEAGATMRRLTTLLSALDTDGLSLDRKARLNDARQRLRAGCQSLFNERLSSDLIEPLRIGGAELGPDEMADLEAAARGLRVLETEARRAGEDKKYEMLLGRTADMVREMVVQGGLDRAGGLRLMEIVAGPDVALALLGEEV